MCVCTFPNAFVVVKAMGTLIRKEASHAQLAAGSLKSITNEGENLRKMCMDATKHAFKKAVLRRVDCTEGVQVTVTRTASFQGEGISQPVASSILK